MATIHPFRALRPTAARAAAVAAVPYDVVSTDEARTLASGNPFSFLHVTRSEIDLPADTDPYAASVYETARENLVQIRTQAPLVLEDRPTLYVYRLRMGTHEQTGIGGCFSIDEYDRNLIKKHERTRRDKEDDRTRHILEVRAQTGVVFLTYRGSSSIDAVTQRIVACEPLYDFTADDGVRHTVWASSAADTTELVAGFADVPALYIADGHHRAASAARARDELRRTSSPGRNGAEANIFIAVAFPDRQTQILPYNRTVRDLAGKTAEEFLTALRAGMTVTDGGGSPARKGEVAMFMGGRWYTLDLARIPPADGSRASSLDVALLQRQVLEAILGIGDVRTDKRIDFVGGARGVAALEDAVQSGRASVAFSMFPVTVDDLMAVSDAGGIMPPKSTWFEPKIRDGLLTHLI